MNTSHNAQNEFSIKRHSSEASFWLTLKAKRSASYLDENLLAGVI
jgi:hypothetical protein